LAGTVIASNPSASFSCSPGIVLYLTHQVTLITYTRRRERRITQIAYFRSAKKIFLGLRWHGVSRAAQVVTERRLG